MKKILLVDDEKDIIDFLGNILKRNNYEVASATKGKEAIELAKQLIPDLIILDVLMPDMAGTEVASELEKNPSTKGIPVMFLTGTLTKKEELPDKTKGRHYSVAKPVSAEELMNKIAKVFADQT